MTELPNTVDAGVAAPGGQAEPAVTLPGAIGRPGHAIVLIGAPGAGKTTTGAILARMLGVQFTDVDAEIERRVGKPISEIFIDEGEQWFRALERDTTIELLDAGGVLSLGGGAAMNPEIRRALAGHEVVWLKVSITQATRRVGMNSLRPLLLGNVRSRLVTLLQERTPVYEATATLAIDTDSRKPRAVARDIIAALSGAEDPSEPGDGSGREGDDGDASTAAAPPSTSDHSTLEHTSLEQATTQHTPGEQS